MKKRRDKKEAINTDTDEAESFVGAANSKTSVIIKGSKPTDQDVSKNVNTEDSTEISAERSTESEPEEKDKIEQGVEPEQKNKPEAEGKPEKIDETEDKEKQALINEYKAISELSPKGKVSKSKPYSLRMNAYQNAIIDFICKIEDISKVALINECMFNKTNLPDLLKKAKKKVDKM